MTVHFRSIDSKCDGRIPRVEIEPIEKAIATQILDVNCQIEADQINGGNLTNDGDFTDRYTVDWQEYLA